MALVVVVAVAAGIISKVPLNNRLGEVLQDHHHLGGLLLDRRHNGAALPILSSKATAPPLLSKATDTNKDRVSIPHNSNSINTNNNNNTNNTILHNNRATDMAAPRRKFNTNLATPSSSRPTALPTGQAPLLRHEEHNNSATARRKDILSSTVTVPESGRR